MKRKIVSIGGGRIMLPKGRVPQTLSIDEEIVSLSGKPKPRLLFIPTASLDDKAYCERINDHFGNRLKCRVETLLLYRNRPSASHIKQQILNADIIYVGGGNTLRMMNLWRQLGIDKLMNRARLQGTVLSGLSAGSICWFRQGNSDSRKFANKSDKTLIKVSGLGYADALVCPHYDVEKHRQPALKAMMKNTKGVAIALENCTAIKIVGDEYRIITSMKNKNAWKVCWHKGSYIKEKLAKNTELLPLSDLLMKSN
jgi:dipeptidase E